MKIDKDNIKLILIILVVSLGIGYAYINSNLNINGTAQVNSANWDVHWANVQVSSGSVTGTNVVTAPTIQNQTTVNYSIVLPTPREYYEFTVDAVNGGSIDAMIDTIDSKLNGATITTLPTYLSYEVTYSDGTALQPNHELLANTTETYKVKVKYRDDIELSQIPASDQTLSLSFTVTYRQANENAEEVIHATSFADDDWAIVIKVLKRADISPYSVGDEKEVDLGTLGTHTLRIANTSTPAECSTEGFSQTACGVVLEFSDIITTHEMNSTGTNVGGWQASSMREYVNNDIYNALPEVLRNAIIVTTVVSGHGSTTGETNFTSTDKLYLLSSHEVFEDVDGNTIDYWDTAYANTRQLDYYSSQNVTIGETSNYLGAIKQYNGFNDWWWLRSTATDISRFYRVDHLGMHYDYYADMTIGVSPAFRIA